VPEHARTAKALGRQVRGFDETTWATHRFDLVVTGNLAKLDQHPEMRDYLLGTSLLVEASPTDQIWGPVARAFKSERYHRDQVLNPGEVVDVEVANVRALSERLRYHPSTGFHDRSPDFG